MNAGEASVVSVAETAVDPAHQGRLVHVSGPVTAARAAADPLFHVTVPDAVVIQRHVKMYQWAEHKEEHTQQNTGGSQTTTTTYTYSKGWSERLIDSAKFKKPDGHANPGMPLHSATIDAQGIKLGAFRLDQSVVDKLRGEETLAPPDSANAAGVEPSFRKVGDGFYHGASSDQPAVGDMEVTYAVIKAQPFSIVAAQLGDSLAPFRGKDGRVIELVDQGTRAADDMFAEAKSQAALVTWILRGVGFLMMMLGLAMIAEPISWLASMLPFLSGLVDAAAFMAAFVISVPLTLVTIAIAWLAHRPLLGLGLIAAGLVGGFVLHRMIGHKPAAAIAGKKS